ncbi:VTT domain-containing protein [Arthrobacter sp. Sa2BUA2]|uniref:VTT domain-containing protein n=1 Tax=Arthrobacter pullicola TaxID=2762224 RepID=A0ABR8YG30_9MICC|nr:VTT domain-containing protein [Arthrobacter pullicola]MBD8043170.1 VTT domain-containing protein [Arthrobacter pullicola]
MDNINSFVLTYSGAPWVYLVLFACCLLDGFFPPIPSESLVVGLSALIFTASGPNVWLILLAAAAGAFIGDNIAYALGRTLRTDRFRWMRGARMQRGFVWARKELDKRAVSLILIARFIPVGRVVVNLTAGATRYPRRMFVALTGLSAVLWAAYSVAIGALAGAWFQEHHLLAVVVAVAVALVLGLIIDRIINKLRGPTPMHPGEPAGQPVQEKSRPQ